MKSRLSILFVLVLLAVTVLACGSSNTTPTKIGEATSASNAQSDDAPAAVATTEAPKLQTYKVGDVIQVGDLTVVVNGISYPEPKDMYEPDDGNKFVAVDVTIENVSSEAQSLFAMMQMTLKDDTGRDFTQDMKADISAGGNAPNGEIAPGEKKRGTIGYQVPNDAKGFQFVFDASLFGTGKVFVDLGE